MKMQVPILHVWSHRTPLQPLPLALKNGIQWGTCFLSRSLHVRKLRCKSCPLTLIHWEFSHVWGHGFSLFDKFPLSSSSSSSLVLMRERVWSGDYLIVYMASFAIFSGRRLNNNISSILSHSVVVVRETWLEWILSDPWDECMCVFLKHSKKVDLITGDERYRFRWWGACGC